MTLFRTSFSGQFHSNANVPVLSMHLSNAANGQLILSQIRGYQIAIKWPFKKGACLIGVHLYRFVSALYR